MEIEVLEEFIGIDPDFFEKEAREDGSDIGCNDCPDDECTGHCMSCSYRSV